MRHEDTFEHTPRWRLRDYLLTVVAEPGRTAIVCYLLLTMVVPETYAVPRTLSGFHGVPLYMVLACQLTAWWAKSVETQLSRRGFGALPGLSKAYEYPDNLTTTIWLGATVLEIYLHIHS